eukprot:m.910394 g.910394  ORF g.910394 m.910394 type:complete len:533 (+) comp23722_c0_seq1:196-1794(+)
MMDLLQFSVVPPTFNQFVSLVLLSGTLVASQPDGNPHHWDRRRRCDQIDYDPPCGACEGYGGIPYGDQNDQIHLSTCTVVANASTIHNPIKPIWGPTFTIHHYNEVLIGPKTDPFCFDTFPSNTSAGDLCYRPDSGSQVYDVREGRGLRYDLNVKTELGNTTTEVLHQGVNMWIINKFPWYAAGIHQCICTTVHSGSDPSSPTMYPVDYNWTDQMYYMGREKLGVEYLGPSLVQQILDHWAFGPHHVWSVPETGEIRRMWQPYNGLQVFQNGTNDHTVNTSLFDDVPPALCKANGATMRIGCDNDGYPTPPNKTTTAVPAMNQTHFDRVRAEKPKPRAHYRGESFQHMSQVLNGWLKSGKHTANGGTKPCSEFTAAELQQLQAILYLARDLSLNDVYLKANDNRKLRASLQDLESTWNVLNKAVAAHPTEAETLSLIQRDGHCHETVMWYVHHVSEDMKAVLREIPGLRIPLLSPAWHGKTCMQARTSAEAGGEALDAVFHRVCDAYREQVTCASCHANVAPPGHAFLQAKF